MIIVNSSFQVEKLLTSFGYRFQLICVTGTKRRVVDFVDVKVARSFNDVLSRRRIKKA